MQLVAYGAQDIYLTGNPQITFFKVVYRRHTNFAMETIPQTFSGSADFGKRVSCTIPRNGDLVGRCYLRVKFATAPLWDQIDLRRLIKNCELEIGGQRIDKQYYQWQAAWQSLTYSQSQQESLKVVTESSTVLSSTDLTDVATQYYYLPLDFFFCRHAGLALPLIALQYHEVKITVELDTKANVKQNIGVAYTTFDADATPVAGDVTAANAAIRSLNSGKTYVLNEPHPGNTLPGTAATAAWNNAAIADGVNADISSCELLVDYFYLDTDERRRFAQVSHEYLIEQVQHTGTVSLAVAATASTKNVKLNFNHPVKELVWVIEDAADTNAAYVDSAKLQLNGHDRFRSLDGDYFMHVQRLQHHTGVSGVFAGTSSARARTTGTKSTGAGVYCYSFAIKPEEHQPSGTCNFSRIDNATLQLSYVAANSARNLWVFAHGYNVLRVMSGMGGLAYSN